MCGRVMPKHLTFEQIFWVFQSYSGLILFSIVGYYIGWGIGGLVGGTTVKVLGSTIGLFLPSLVMTYFIARKW